MNPPVGLDRDRMYRTAIDQQIQTWLADAPTRLAEDANRPFGAVTNRFRGRFLVLGLAATEGEGVGECSIPAAASVELLYGQALLNGQAAGLTDTGFEGVDRTHALLASDYLHSLAYAGFERLDVDPAIGNSCFQSISEASRLLASCWTRAEEEGLSSVHAIPIEPIVMRTAGDLAGILGQADEDCRRALGATGTVLGVARFRGQDTENRSRTVAGLIPDDWAATDLMDRVDARSVEELLAPLPDSRPLSRLRDVADSVVDAPVDQLIHE